MYENSSSGFPAQNSSLTQPEDCSTADSTAERTVKALAYFIILLVSLFGNILVILVIYKNKQLRKSINYFVFNMAVSDLFTPLTIMPIKIVQIISGSPVFKVDSPLILGNILCKLCYFLPDISLDVSIESLLLISLDRFVAVVFPFKTKLISSKVRLICILCTWIIAISIHAPYFYTFRLLPTENETYECRSDWGPAFDHVETHRRYVTATFIVFIPIPICILAIMYGTIAYTLRRNSNCRKNMSSNYSKTHGYQLNRQITRLSVAIIIAFVVCMVPLLMFMFTLVFLWYWRQPPICAFRTVIPFIVYFMLYSWSAVNPCICFIFCKNFRSGLRQILLSKREANLSMKTATTPVYRKRDSSIFTPGSTEHIHLRII